MVKLTEKTVLGRARSQSLEAVKNLNCWGSGLTDVSIISQMQNVEVINASANSISSLRAFSHCYNLRELYLRKNATENINEVLYLKDLSQLRILWLSGNPCCENMSNEKYRLTVIKALPMLTKLDNVEITIEELKRAKEEGDDLMKPEESSADKLQPKESNTDEQKVDLADTVEKGSKESDEEKKSKENVEKDTEPEKRKESASEEESSSDEESKDDSSQNASSEIKSGFAVDETNELRRQLGLKPLPVPSSGVPSARASARPRTLGQSTTSINVLAATLALIKEMDEEALATIRDAVEDRLYMLARDERSDIKEISETSGTSDLTNGTSSPEKNNNNASAEMV